MAYPVNFGTQSSPEPMSNLDLMFNQVGAMIQIPCSASGTNAISLTPLVNCPALSAYNELGGYRFRAVGTSSGAVTAQYNGLGFLPVYHADGVTQANISDIVSGQQYVFMFSQALNSGSGGFFFESPSQPVATTQWYPPGGRLTFVSATPVMATTPGGLLQTIFYAPYVSPFVPIYTGSVVQPFQFTSSLSDQVGLSLSMGGGAQWGANVVFDVFAYLNAGVPALCAIAWTNPTTRATTLGVFGGFLTNSGSATALTGVSSTVTLPANRGTWLGTIQCNTSNGTSQWIFGTAASGGGAGSFLLYNYYNQVNFNSLTTDNGAQYTYTSATPRQARASVGNQCQILQGSSERCITSTYINQTSTVAGVGNNTTTGIGVNVINAFYAQNLLFDPAAGASAASRAMIGAPVAYTGSGFIAALEASDGTNANNFCAGSLNQLFTSFWA